MMKISIAKMLRHNLLTVCVLSIGVATPAWATTVVDFEDIAVAPDSAVTGGPGAAGVTPLVSHGVEFNRTYFDQFNCCPGAFAVSNQTDLTTAGFTNPYSAYHLPGGGGVDASDNFAVAFNTNAGDAVVTLPAPTTVQGAYFTNNTFAYLAVVEGDDGGNNFSRQFVDGDFFLLEVIGKDSGGAETGRADVYLADYRNGQTLALGAWTWFDLTALGGNVKTLEFAFTSTDANVDGNLTPSYFALDNLTFGAVSSSSPEPSSLGLLLLSIAMLCGRWRGRRSVIRLT